MENKDLEKGFVTNYLRLEAGATGVEARVVEVAGEFLAEVPLDVDPGAEPLQLVAQSSVRALPIARGLGLQDLVGDDWDSEFKFDQLYYYIGLVYSNF